ncbi:MAG: RCC1 domain-containing protein, partial [bacterium]|nr:RCC1 domain-containing protein [bacterium]
MKNIICDANVRRACGAPHRARLAGLVFLAASTAWAGIGITGAPVRVAWDVGSCAVAGTNTSDIVGGMWVSNATAGGAALNFNGSGDAFVAPAIALQVGKNYLTVYGTNAAGDGSSTAVNLWRYNPDGSGQQAGSHYGRRWRGPLTGWGRNDYGQTNCPGGNDFVAVAAGQSHALALRSDGTLTGWGANGDGQTNCPGGNDFVTIAAGFSYSLALKFSPFMDITNGATLVTYATTQSTLGGTNSPWMDALNGIVGTIWWSNALNSAHGTCAAAQSWTIANIAVGFGTNVITVYGTNVYGWLGYASVNIIRAFPAGTQIVLGAPIDGYLTNQFAVSFNVTYGDTIAYRYLATNSAPVFNDVQTFLFTNKVTFSDTGTIYWTGLGYDSSYNVYWAFETNRLTIQKTLTPGVHLVAPVSGTALTNVFACMLDVDYGAATLDQQLSINAGASWFAYAAENPVVFTSVGTYRWTARGRTAAGWWRAPETNTLVVTTNYSGDRAIFLAEPADGLVTTNGALDFRVLTYGAAFAFTQVSVDQGAFATVTFPTNITLAVGQHQWTARGGGLPGPVYTDAPTTNVFWVMPEDYSMSVVCITSGVRHVDYAEVTAVLAGTNTSELVGGMWVANASAGGAAIGFSRSGLAFTTPPVPLNVGTNVIEVHGTNVYGVPAGDSMVITREGIAPLVDITNTPVTLSYDVTSYAVAGTNNPNCVGGMWVSNATAGGAASSFSHSGLAFTTPAVELQVGANAIGVYGTNILGVVAGDSVTITRNIPGTGGPFIDATSTPVFVIYDMARYDVAGTNNANVIGGMSWTNTTTGGAGTLAAAASWRIPVIAMAVGANEIVVRGTNLLGATASDSVTITRGDPPTATPYVNVTNADRTVIYDVASTSIGGSNNIGVVALWWSNSLTSAGGTLVPGSPWWATNGIALAVGTNVISVYGTNALNV